jgi:hypothetical protein
MKTILGLLIASAVIAAPATAAVNLVVNGGFEAPVTSPGSFVQVNGGNSFTGWNVLGSGTNVILINQSYSEAGLVFNPNSGSASIDLTGAGNTGPTTGISQVVATGAGTHMLSFWVGNASPTGGNGGSYTQPSTVNLSINGGPIQSFTNSDNTDFAINWKQFSVNFVANGATTIAFTNADGNDNMLGLDDVSVSLVPEPASWALLIAGFGLTGAAMRRRRAVTAG